MIELKYELNTKESQIEMNYPFNKTASFDVDAQKGFTNITGELPVPGGENIVPALNAQAKFAKYRIGSKDAHPLGALYFAVNDEEVMQPIDVDNKNMDIYWPSHCVVGTVGFELLNNLPAPIDYDFFVYKGIEDNVHPYGACYHDLAETKSTGVIEYLKICGVENVIVGGLATDYCVKTTALQLKRAGFNVIINLAACRGVDDTTTDAALQELADAEVDATEIV